MMVCVKLFSTSQRPRRGLWLGDTSVQKILRKHGTVRTPRSTSTVLDRSSSSDIRTLTKHQIRQIMSTYVSSPCSLRGMFSSHLISSCLVLSRPSVCLLLAAIYARSYIAFLIPALGYDQPFPQVKHRTRKLVFGFFQLAVWRNRYSPFSQDDGPYISLPSVSST